MMAHKVLRERGPDRSLWTNTDRVLPFAIPIFAQLGAQMALIGYRYVGASPSKKSVGRFKTKIGEVLVPGNLDPWPEVCLSPSPGSVELGQDGHRESWSEHRSCDRHSHVACLS
jgi:hypothetical protein